jgi:hypothetical protein
MFKKIMLTLGMGLFLFAGIFAVVGLPTSANELKAGQTFLPTPTPKMSPTASPSVSPTVSPSPSPMPPDMPMPSPSPSPTPKP